MPRFGIRNIIDVELHNLSKPLIYVKFKTDYKKIVGQRRVIVVRVEITGFGLIEGYSSIPPADFG